ncbi:hypothetical protein E2C01_027333 [Portunus trituberculatus]|uniref:Uncharacterized protein n=1 Tax=Portunus trituberculatus TaxID=210409 RepID=A0A5B7ELN2_PORTR|nr:hypothetical protein [Portunus trituberculatus]
MSGLKLAQQKQSNCTGPRLAGSMGFTWTCSAVRMDSSNMRAAVVLAAGPGTYPSKWVGSHLVRGVPITNLLQQVLRSYGLQYILLARLTHFPAHHELIQHEVCFFKVEDDV